MKKIKATLLLALMTGAVTFAQRGSSPDRHQDSYHRDLTVEQLATLKTKKMTLALDLTEKQREQVFDFNVTEAEFHKEKMEERKAKKAEREHSRLTSVERYAMENKRLDHMIAKQEGLKKILSDEQFKQWKKMILQKHAIDKQQRQKERRGR